jgi:hypothetical protein
MRRYTITVYSFIVILIAVGIYLAYMDKNKLFLSVSIESESVTASTSVTGTDVVRDLVRDYGGVSSKTLNQAIVEAKNYFTQHSNSKFTITIPAGTYSLSKTITLTDVHPGPEGRLIIAGAGKDSTILEQSPDAVGITGDRVYRVTIEGVHFTISSQTTTQGHVVSVAPGLLVLDISPGFPTPLDVLDTAYSDVTGCEKVSAAAGGWGRYVKAWSDSTTDPHIDNPDQPQYSFCKPTPVPGIPNRWVFPLKEKKNMSPLPDYTPGTFISVKSKFMDSAYEFCGGDDFFFHDVRFTERSRGIWHCGFNHVHLDGVEIVRGAAINGQVPILSSPGGGPQIGELGMPSMGHLIENSTFVATGDDAIAFFDASGLVRTTTVRDSYGRVNLNKSPGVVIDPSTSIVRTRLVRQ